MFAAHRSLHIRPWILDELQTIHRPEFRENTWNLWWDRCVLNLSIDAITLHCFELREEEGRRQPERHRKIPMLQRHVRRWQCLWLIQEAASSNGFMYSSYVHLCIWCLYIVVLPSCTHKTYVSMSISDSQIWKAERLHSSPVHAVDAKFKPWCSNPETKVEEKKWWMRWDMNVKLLAMNSCSFAVPGLFATSLLVSRCRGVPKIGLSHGIIQFKSF